jgi:thiol:disulfide interchange protein DsbA
MNNLFRSLALSLSLVAGFAHALAAEPVAGRNYEVLKLPQPILSKRVAVAVRGAGLLHS